MALRKRLRSGCAVIFTLILAYMTSAQPVTAAGVQPGPPTAGSAATAGAAPQTRLLALQRRVRALQREVYDFWLDHGLDTTFGGFYGVRACSGRRPRKCGGPSCGAARRTPPPPAHACLGCARRGAGSAGAPRAADLVWS